MGLGFLAARHSDVLQRQHSAGSVVLAKTYRQVRGAVLRGSEKHTAVLSFALDGKIHGLPDADLAPLQPHQVEVAIGIRGVPPAGFVAPPVVPLERHPRERETHGAGAAEVR